jgi:hypothetical protein
VETLDHKEDKEPLDSKVQLEPEVTLVLSVHKARWVLLVHAVKQASPGP